MKDIESRLLQVFSELQGALPKLSTLNFEIHKFSGIPAPKLSGFYHTDEGCFHYETIDKLKEILILSGKSKKVVN
jgi:hypothetical protein